ncbi:MAG: hypothetical protein FJZ66_02265 [Bacteroidetes bacterium]|nr:hypothetical protein [Bacteroidota bacterium]
MSNLLDNDYFRDFLQQADEALMVCTSIHYLPYRAIEQSLINNEEYFHLFICDNYPEFNLSDTEENSENKAFIRQEITGFLCKQTRQEKVEIYLGFMTSYGVIEDLMYLGLEEREELVRDLGLNEG